MKHLAASLVVGILVGVSLVAAQTPVAVRVEIEPLGAEGEDTRVALLVQIAPVDRARIGHSAMIRTDLGAADEPDEGQLWAVRVESDGSARIEVVWPPGEYDLRVDIESPNGQESGIWVGRVQIPRFGPQGRAEVVVPASPTPEPEPTIDPKAIAAAVAITPPPTRSQPSSTGKISLAPMAFEEEADAEVEVRTEIVPDPVRTPEPSPEAPPPASTVKDEGSGAVPTAVVETEVVQLTQTPEPTDSPTLTPMPTPTPTAIATPVSLVAPLRVKEPAAAGASERTRGHQPAVAEPVEEAPAELVAAFEAWEAADPSTRDLTVIVTNNGGPVRGLRTEDLRLRVGGTPVQIEAVGDAETAPLLLGIVVDLSPGVAEGWGDVRGRLAPLAGRAGGGRGRLFIAPAAEGTEWQIGSSSFSEAPPGVSDAGLASLIASSLVRFEGRRGRTFLLVVTDGRADVSRTAWKEAIQVSAEAGVPVLVIALWEADFNQRVRKELRRVADLSGGRLFLVQGAGQLDGVVARYGGMLDGGVALRFQAEEGTTGASRAVSLESAVTGYRVRFPKKIR
ncbi:MAG: hypothetical protein ACC742_10185 [Thermoanaerobaculales bacterium]